MFRFLSPLHRALARTSRPLHPFSCFTIHRKTSDYRRWTSCKHRFITDVALIDRETATSQIFLQHGAHLVLISRQYNHSYLRHTHPNTERPTGCPATTAQIRWLRRKRVTRCYRKIFLELGHRPTSKRNQVFKSWWINTRYEIYRVHNLFSWSLFHNSLRNRYIITETTTVFRIDKILNSG